MQLKEINKILDGKYINRYNLVYETRNGNEKIYEIVSHDKNLTIEKLPNDKKINAVVIIVVDKEFNHICLNKELRLSVNKEIFNFPAGMIEKGETIEEATKRELFEETGLIIDEILFTMMPAYSAIGVCNERTTVVFCTTKNKEFSPHYDETEEITPLWVSQKDAFVISTQNPCTVRTQSILSMFGCGLLKDYIKKMQTNLELR